MHNHYGHKTNFRPQIQKFASESIIYDIIEQQLKLIKLRNNSFPRTIQELPKNHFLIDILQNEHLKHKNFVLKPFVSPTTIMKAYNKKYSKYKFYATEIYYFYEPTLNNSKLENIVDANQFFFEVKNASKQKGNGKIENKIKEIMNAYLNEPGENHEDSNQYQNSYVIPESYFPLICIKIKYSVYKNYETKNGFQYLLMRYDEHQRFKIDSMTKMITEYKRKQKLKSTIKLKMLHRANQLKPEEISKKELLKTVYRIKNFSIGWVETSQNDPEGKYQFQTYFDVRTLQNNIGEMRKFQGKEIKTKSFLFFKKGEFQIPRIEILSFLYDEIVIKCIIKLSDIKKVDFFNKYGIREIYLYINTYPQYFFHHLNKNTGYTLFNLNPWERIENFPIEYQPILAESLFLRNMLSSNSVICIDWAVGRAQFNKVIRYFRAQQIIESELMPEKPVYKIAEIQNNSILNLEKKFYKLLQNVGSENRITVHHIKFSLLSLKHIDKSKITFEQIVDFLERLQKQDVKNLESHNLALKVLCLRPHELLTNSFGNVYLKAHKKLELLKGLADKYKNLEKTQIIKLQQKLQSDIFSQISDASDVSLMSWLTDMDEQIIEQVEMIVEEIQKTQIILIPRVKLTPNGMIYGGWSMEVASKVLKHYHQFQHQFLKCEIVDDQQKKLISSPHILQTYIRNLMDKIKVIHEDYVPLGWSQSQLRQGILWYSLESKHITTMSRDDILKFLGDFDEKKNPLLKNPALKAARIGQNFGSSWSFDASKIKFIYEEDILANKNAQKMYSDGIGCISEFNMSEFCEKLGLDSLAAIQIRYKGIKGILSLNKELEPNTAIIRKSMVKYECHHPQSVKYFDIIDFSKYKVGYLNRQIILLLIANHVPSQSILDLQQQYIELMEKKIFEILFENICFEDEEEHVFQKQNDKLFESLSEVLKMILTKTWQDKKAEVNKLIYNQSFFEALKIQAKRKLLSRLKQKCRIRVQKSVRLFGILDQFNVLKEYEVYCSIQKPSDAKKVLNFKKNKKTQEKEEEFSKGQQDKKVESKRKNITGKCILTKNPCLHPADIRVVTCVSDQEIMKRLKEKGKDPNLFKDLVNVIVFPQQGKYPLTMEISQSDLDGDEFFLCWDKRIVPFKHFDPFIIAEQVPFIQRKWTGSDYKEMLDFFVEFQNFNKLGRLANNHLIQADLRGVSCKECIELCKIHSVAVQYPKRGYDFTINDDLTFHMYPHYMEKEHPLKSYRSKSVLGKLYDQIINTLNMRSFNNQDTIFRNEQKNYYDFIQIHVNLELLQEMRMKSKNSRDFNRIVEKYEPEITEETQEIDKDEGVIQEGQEPVQFKEVQKEEEIQSQEFYKNNQIPFSRKIIQELSKWIELDKQVNNIHMNEPFSLIEILNTFNYLCIYFYELQYLSQLLENEHQSVYTIYFELHTSTKNRNNSFLFERITELREKWLKIFAEEVVKDGAFSNTDDFMRFYFNDLIQKKPAFSDTVQALKNMKEKLSKRNFSKVAALYMVFENSQCDDQLIEDEVKNLKIVKKSIDYDTFRYSNLKELNSQIYRKLVLFFMVSTYFDKMISSENIQKIITSFKFQAQFKSLFNEFTQQLQSANKFYNKNKVEFLGFTWFCLPKLMVIWWRDIIKHEQAKIDQKSKEDQKDTSEMKMNKLS